MVPTNIGAATFRDLQENEGSVDGYARGGPDALRQLDQPVDGRLREQHQERPDGRQAPRPAARDSGCRPDRSDPTAGAKLRRGHGQLWRVLAAPFRAGEPAHPAVGDRGRHHEPADGDRTAPVLLDGDWYTAPPNNGTAYGAIGTARPPIALSPGTRQTTLSGAIAAGAGTMSTSRRRAGSFRADGEHGTTFNCTGKTAHLHVAVWVLLRESSGRQSPRGPESARLRSPPLRVLRP